MTETAIETTKEDIKRIKDGLKQINESGLLEKNVNYAAVKHVEIKDLFLKTVEQIDEEKEDQIPVPVILLYNEFNVDADDETETEIEIETEPTVKKERTKKEPKVKTTPGPELRAQLFKKLIETEKMNKREIEETIMKEQGGSETSVRYHISTFISLGKVFGVLEIDENGIITAIVGD